MPSSFNVVRMRAAMSVGQVVDSLAFAFAFFVLRIGFPSHLVAASRYMLFAFAVDYAPPLHLMCDASCDISRNLFGNIAKSWQEQNEPST